MRRTSDCVYYFFLNECVINLIKFLQQGFHSQRKHRLADILLNFEQSVNFLLLLTWLLDQYVFQVKQVNFLFFSFHIEFSELRVHIIHQSVFKILWHPDVLWLHRTEEWGRKFLGNVNLLHSLGNSDLGQIGHENIITIQVFTQVLLVGKLLVLGLLLSNTVEEFVLVIDQVRGHGVAGLVLLS